MTPSRHPTRVQGTIAWISHLGRRAPRLSGALLARGFPGNAPAASLTAFVRANVPAAVGFVAPHSLLPPRRMSRLCRRFAEAETRGTRRFAQAPGSLAAAMARRPGSGRLLYNALSAATLHVLLTRFTPLATPTVAVLPFPETAHALLSIACLLGAIAAALVEPATYGLLGAGQFLGWSPRFATPPPGSMDAITWMGVSAWRGGKELLGERFLLAGYGDAARKARHGDALGAACFVLFTGVSILPAELTLGDCLTRGVAAFYLRRRSKSFRAWVASVEGPHALTWGLRALLLLAAFRAAAKENGRRSSGDPAETTVSTDAMSPFAAAACAAATALILRFAERPNASRRGRRPIATTKHDSGDSAEVSVAEVSFENVDAKGSSEVRRSARVSSRAARRGGAAERAGRDSNRY